MSSIGTVLSFGIGAIVPLFFHNEDILQMAIDYQITIPLPITISWTSVAITIAFGMGVPFMFGIIPAWKATRKPPVFLINPEYMEKEEMKRHDASRWTKNHGAARAAVLLGGLVISAVMIPVTASHIFANNTGSVSFSDASTIPWIVGMIVSPMMFCIIFINLISGSFGSVSNVFVKVAKRKLGAVHAYMPRIIQANTRRMKNTIGATVFCTAFVIAIIVAGYSLVTEESMQRRNALGGDLVIFDPQISQIDLPGIRSLPGVGAATLYTYSMMASWNQNTNALSTYMVNRIDTFGGVKDGIMENLNVFVIDPESYLAVNLNDGTKFAIGTFEDPSEFINRLSTNGTIILQQNLANELGKGRGSTVAISINGVRATLTVAGTTRDIPCSPFMRYTETMPFKMRSVFIGRGTMESMIDAFTGHVDIMLKNMSVYKELKDVNSTSIPWSMLGYSSARISRSVISPSFLDSIPGIKNFSYRFSTFDPAMPELKIHYDPSRFVSLGNNASINITKGSFQLPNRLYIFDPGSELLPGKESSDSNWFMTSEQPVTEACTYLDQTTIYPPVAGASARYMNGSASEVLYALDKKFHWEENISLDPTRNSLFGNASICVTNRYVTAMESATKQAWVYELRVGDTINATFPNPKNPSQTITFPFEIAATIDNHLAYWHDNQTSREDYALSGKTLNYDFNVNSTNIQNKSFTNIFDVDCNVFLTTYKQMRHIAYELSGFPTGLFPGVTPDEIVNHVYVTIDDGANVDTVVSSIKTALGSIANISVFPYKQTFIDKVANAGALSVRFADGASQSQVIESLREWYTSHGYGWRQSAVVTVDMISHDTYIGPLINLFSVVTIFSLIISSIGLVVIVYASLKARTRSFGVMRAIGFDDTTVRRMAFIETISTSSIGTIFGVIMGCLLMWLIFTGIAINQLSPEYFGIPWLQVAGIAGVICVISAIASMLLSRVITSKTISENVRFNQ